MATLQAAAPRVTRPQATEEKGLSDQQLLALFVQSGCEDAFGGLVKRYGAAVWRVCRRLLHQEQDAEDAFQAVFLILARKAASIRKGEAVGSWLYGVAYRTAMKARQNAERPHNPAQQPDTTPDPAPAPWSQAACRELQRLLDEEVHNLPEKYRAPFVLCCLEGLSKTEAAAELGWKEGTLSGRLARAREYLQKRLARRGVLLSAVLTAGALAQNTLAAAAPPALMHATVQAVLLPAAGKAAVSTLSPAAVALAEGLMHTMAVAKVKAGFSLLLLLTTVVATAGYAAFQVEPPVPQDVKIEAAAPDDPIMALPPRTLKGNTPGTWFATYAPMGERLASGGDGGDVTLWTQTVARAIHPNPVREGIFWDAAFSPDGRIMATCHDTNVVVSEISTGRIFHTLQMKKLLRTVAFSPDGKYVAAGAGTWKDPDLPYESKIWDLATGKELANLEGHQGVVFRVHFSPDGKTLATSSKDKTIRIWEVPSGKLRGILKGHLAPAKGMVFLPDGTLVSASWDKTIRFWDVNALKETKSWKVNIALACLDASPDGSLLAGAEGATESKGAAPLKVWEVATGKEKLNLEGHESRILGVAFTRDGLGLLAAGGKINAFGEILYWDLVSGQLRGTHRSPAQWMENVTVSPDGRRVVTAATNRLSLWDLDYIHQERTWTAHTHFVSCGAFSKDGAVLITGSWDTTIGVWNASTGDKLGVLKGHKGGLRAIALLPDGKTLASAAEDGVIKLWDLPSFKEKATLEGNAKTVYSLAVSPDGKTLASGGGNHRAPEPGELLLWDLETGKIRHAIPNVERVVWSVAFSPDGKQLAAGVDNGTIQIHRGDTGTILRTLPARSVRPVAFSPDGRLLAMAMGKAPSKLEPGEGRLRVWDTATWRERPFLVGHNHVVFTVAFSPDGGSLASASQDGTIKLWPVPPAGPGAPAIVTKALPPQVANVSRLVKTAPAKDAPDVEVVEPEAAAQKLGWKVWMALALVLLLGVTLAIGLWRHSRHGTTEPEEVGEDDVIDEALPSAQPEPEPNHTEKIVPIAAAAKVAVKKKTGSTAVAEGSISMRCTECAKKLKVRAELGGRRVKCPECGHSLVIPEP